LQTFDLTALGFDLALLLLQLALGLLVLNLLVLQFVADRVPANRAKAAADRRTRARMADGRADYRTGTRAKDGADARAFFTLSERLPRTSAKEEHNRECNSGGRNPTFAHKRYLLIDRSHLHHPTASNAFRTALERSSPIYRRRRVQIVSASGIVQLAPPQLPHSVSFDCCRTSSDEQHRGQSGRNDSKFAITHWYFHRYSVL
jgi:hypothetical protein